MRPSCILRGHRAARLTLAVVSLAAPAGALAAGAAAQTTPDPLHLSLSPRNVAFGRALEARGMMPESDAGDVVAIQSRPRGTAEWRTLGTTTAGAAGAFVVHVVPRRTGAIRALALPRQSGETASAVVAGGPTPAAASSTQAVTVRARFSVAVRRFAIFGQGRVRVSGRLLPAVGWRVVRLQARTGRGWQTLAQTRTGRRGGFSLRATAGASGQRLRVLFPGDAANARATGAAGSVAVFYQDVASWYNDGGSTACGFHAGFGVANRTLPCGTKVTFMFGGRTVVATVDDRGPFVAGRNWDLNQNTAAALGFGGVGALWVSG